MKFWWVILAQLATGCAKPCFESIEFSTDNNGMSVRWSARNAAKVKLNGEAAPTTGSQLLDNTVQSITLEALESSGKGCTEIREVPRTIDASVPDASIRDAGIADAGPPVQISGVVLDYDIPSANVGISIGDTTVFTDDAGHFTIEAPSIPYTLRAGVIPDAGFAFASDIFENLSGTNLKLYKEVDRTNLPKPATVPINISIDARFSEPIADPPGEAGDLSEITVSNKGDAIIWENALQNPKVSSVFNYDSQKAFVFAIHERYAGTVGVQTELIGLFYREIDRLDLMPNISFDVPRPVAKTVQLITGCNCTPGQDPILSNVYIIDNKTGVSNQLLTIPFEVHQNTMKYYEVENHTTAIGTGGGDRATGLWGYARSIPVMHENQVVDVSPAQRFTSPQNGQTIGCNDTIEFDPKTNGPCSLPTRFGTFVTHRRKFNYQEFGKICPPEGREISITISCTRGVAIDELVSSGRLSVGKRRTPIIDGQIPVVDIVFDTIKFRVHP
jgi:hypothetical protein